jgi:predicted dehydrogenase
VIGEGCHFVDTLRFLAGAPIVKVDATYAEGGEGVVSDIVSIQLGFADGSIGAVHYFGNGNKDVPREHLDVYCGGGILRMDNFRTLTGHRWPGFRRSRLYRQDKGHAAEVAAFIDAVAAGGPSPIAWEEILDVTRATFTADAQRLPAGPRTADASTTPPAR